jgi:hypothetical protein
MSAAQYDSAKIRASIQTLKEFYSGVLALALYEAIRGVAETQNVLRSLQFRFFLLAFCTTLVPFYHGIMRYFDDNYLSTGRDAPKPKPASFLFDYLLFCMIGGLLVWMGAIFGHDFKEDYFIRVYAGLLAVDIFWGFMTHFLTDSYNRVKAWLWLNFAVLIGIGLLWLSLPSYVFQGYKLAMFLLIAPVRSMLDYKLNWDFYFPKANSAEAPSVETVPAGATR